VLPIRSNSNDNGHNGAPAAPANGQGIDLRLMVNDRWCALDLDELLQAVEFAGLPPELIVTYVDRHGRRRYVERRFGRSRSSQPAAGRSA